MVAAGAADIVQIVVLAAGADAFLRVGDARSTGALACPGKYGLNWFMPALVNSSVGSSCGTTGEEARTVARASSRRSR